MTRAFASLRVRLARNAQAPVVVLLGRAALLILAATLGALILGAPIQAEQSKPASADSVLIWNDQVNRAIQETLTDAFKASRDLALESIAVFDTIRSINGGPTFLVRLRAPHDLDPGIAAAAAAHALLNHLFPVRQAAQDAAFAASLAHEPAGPARDRAAAFGAAVADAVFAVRDRDGWDAARRDEAGTAPGRWRPTPPEYLPPLVPQWAALEPFALNRPNQFRPDGPPGLQTAKFRDAAAYVASIGGARSIVRTATQTEIAHYWSDAIGTYAPAGHWNAITATLLAPMDLGLDAEAELFAELNVALADAGIAVADAKYTYWFRRPITVIRAGAAGAPADPDWSPLLATPNHPSYISGHSGFSGAAAVVLTARFGTRPFSFLSASVPGVTRGFTSFQQAAEEAAFSRVLGGIHFSLDNADGLATGRAVGTWTLSAFRRIAADRGPVIVMDRPASDAIKNTHGLTGFALDNHSPLNMVTVRQDGREPFNVAVDDRGRFTIPPRRLEPAGVTNLVIAVRGATGRTATARLVIVNAEDNGAVTVPVSVK
jgi:membrane-associated phospholipid phosphatase